MADERCWVPASVMGLQRLVEGCLKGTKRSSLEAETGFGPEVQTLLICTRQGPETTGPVFSQNFLQAGKYLSQLQFPIFLDSFFFEINTKQCWTFGLKELEAGKGHTARWKRCLLAPPLTLRLYFALPWFHPLIHTHACTHAHVWNLGWIPELGCLS